MPSIIHDLDLSILFFLQENIKSPALNQFMVFITTLGNAGFLWLLIAFTMLTKKRYQRCAITIICAMSLAMFLGNELLKPIFGRIRPCNLYPEVSLLIKRPHSYSFPSGHTMISFAAATVTYHYHRRLGYALLGIAALIAFSRLYLFVHYPSDILGGILFGVSLSLVSIRGMEHAYTNLNT